MNERRWSFEQLISPVTREEFLSNFWEKGHLHVARDTPSYFSDLFSTAEIDHWIVTSRSGLPDSIGIASPDGAENGRRNTRPQDCDIDDVYEAFSRGHSLILNYLEDSWPLIDFSKRLAHDLCAKIGVNAYLTPQASQTFPVHTDDHDVLILQLHGRKAWRLYERKMMPINKRSLEFSNELEAGLEWDGLTETPLRAELDVAPGDVLYIPRGMPHCAVAKESISLHLTVSITPMYWTDFLRCLIEDAQLRSNRLRRALPLSFIEQPAAWQKMRDELPRVLEQLRDELSFDRALDVVRRHWVKKQRFAPDGHFSSLVRLQSISSGTLLEQRPTQHLLFSEKDDALFLTFGHKQVRFPTRIRKAVTFVREKDRFHVSEIPGLDEASQVVLAKRLVREGFLRLSAEELRTDPVKPTRCAVETVSS